MNSTAFYPKISIITVCKNSEQYIAETIESVLHQTYKDIEYIIIDGDSTDSTREIINQYIDRITLFISEPDNGMYDAINKGLQLATGEYIQVLNSDDVLITPDTIEQVAASIEKGNYDYYYGNITKLKDGYQKRVKLFQISRKLLLYSTHGTLVSHPCLFISKELNDRIGGYDTRYRYASDFDYILRAMATGESRGKYLDLDITRFRIHSQSITEQGKIGPERLQILEQHNYFKRPWLARQFYYYLIWIYYKIINIGRGYRPAP